MSVLFFLYIYFHSNNKSFKFLRYNVLSIFIDSAYFFTQLRRKRWYEANNSYLFCVLFMVSWTFINYDACLGVSRVSSFSNFVCIFLNFSFEEFYSLKLYIYIYFFQLIKNLFTLWRQNITNNNESENYLSI